MFLRLCVCVCVISHRANKTVAKLKIYDKRERLHQRTSNNKTNHNGDAAIKRK